MSTLYSSAPSPFGRKVRIAIDVLGMRDRIAVVTADTSDPDDPVRRHNPLGKIPALLLDDGDTLFDSRVIIEYLDALDGRRLLIPARPERIGVLREQALADGILDAALLQVYERRYRPAEHHVESWLAHQRGKVSRALDAFCARLPVARSGVGPSIGEITLACALGYLDFRLEGAWRTTHPALVAWLDDFAQRVPAFGRTAP